MNARDLVRQWEQAVADAAMNQPRPDEADAMLGVCTGLRAGQFGYPIRPGTYGTEGTAKYPYRMGPLRPDTVGTEGPIKYPYT